MTGWYVALALWVIGALHTSGVFWPIWAIVQICIDVIEPDRHPR